MAVTIFANRYFYAPICDRLEGVTIGSRSGCMKELSPSMRTSRLSLSLWILTCAAVLGLFLPALLVERPNFADKTREPFTVFVKHWQVAYGPQQPAAEDWVPFDQTAKAGLSGYRGSVWLQRPIPPLEWRNPYLFLSGMSRFEVFRDGERLYTFNMDGKLRRFGVFPTLHPIAIDPGDEGKTLLIHAEWEGYPFIGNDLVLAGEPDQILYALLQGEMGYLLYSTLYITAGLVGLGLRIRRKEPLYGWFGLMGLSIGLNLLFSCRSLQWFAEIQSLYYWKDLLTPLAIYGFIGFYGSALGAAHERLVRMARASVLLYTLGAACTALASPYVYWKLTTLGVVMVVAAGGIVVTYALFRYPQREERREERRWLVRGYWILIVSSTAGMTALLFPITLNRLMNTHMYAYRIIEGLQPNGLLLFMICMVLAVVNRVRRVHFESERNARELLAKHQELEQFHRDLERLVETRTGELKQANRILSVTLREKAESLAEISVLEERNRIAYEMHDVVGHTLTAAIVQLEATKKLAAREGGVPVDKLDLLNGLVRKALDDIRKAVRLLKSEEPALSLEASMRELIQYTEDTMEIQVDTMIEVPSGLGKLMEQVLYHALQEGLTNGIRHGRCSRFRFTLRTAGETLQFRLVSDGEPYGSAEPGFGLTSMMERVELLGGKVSIRSSAAEDGTPYGCELAIEIPLSTYDHVGMAAGK